MQKILIVIIIIGILTLSSVNINAEIHNLNSTQISKSVYPLQDNVDMLIFISPQYADDEEIHQAINNYISIVKDELNWSVEIIFINSENNFFTDIDDIIENYYENHNIKSCIMVGEDMHTALAGDYDYVEGPSTVPWYTTGGADAYEIIEGGILQRSNKMDICISLIYPTNDLDYSIKKSQIISVFNKFCIQRHIYYAGDLLVFVDAESAQMHDNITREIYQKMADYGNLYYKEDPTYTEVQNSLNESYSMYFVDGHSNPSSTSVNSKGGASFKAYYLSQLETPFFGATGCYVNGWFSEHPDNNRLDPSITKEGKPHFGSMIFTSPRLRVMVLGVLTQTGKPYPVSFIEHDIQNLTSGMTLAESMIGHVYSGDYQTVIGDPTFHYSFSNEKPECPKITGETNGKTEKEYEYIFNAEDPDGDGVKYFINWGDNTTEITEFGLSGENTTVKHIWQNQGIYNISSKAIDLYGNESNFSKLRITVPLSKNKNLNSSRINKLDRILIQRKIIDIKKLFLM